MDKIEKKKKTKYDHVGRPTNEEVDKLKKKKTLKIVGVVISFVFVLGLGGMFYFSNGFSLEMIMGKSLTNHYSENMKNVQKGNEYNLVTFVPDKIVLKTYYSQSKVPNSKEKFIDHLYRIAGYGDTSKYKWTTIKFYLDGKYIGQSSAKASNIILRKEQVGKTLALKLYVKNKKNKNKPEATYLRMKVTGSKVDKNAYISCGLSTGDDKNNKFWWPIGLGNDAKPISTVINSNYGNRTGGMHYGMDIGTNGQSDIPIIAAYDGVVYNVVNKCSKSTTKDYGTYVTLKHNYNGKDIFTIYAHMKCGSIPSNIKINESVKAGTKLGIMGNTGLSSGTHLHFEMRKDNTIATQRASKNLDPNNFISTSNPYPNGVVSCKLNK